MWHAGSCVAHVSRSEHPLTSSGSNGADLGPVGRYAWFSALMTRAIWARASAAVWRSVGGLSNIRLHPTAPPRVSAHSVSPTRPVRTNDAKVVGLPELSRFFGIVIRMFVEAGESHRRPHFHAYYQDAAAVFSIDTIECLG